MQLINCDILITTGSFKKLNSLEQEIFKAKITSVRVDSISSKELNNVLIDIIEKTYFLCGMEVDPKYSAIQIPELSNDLRKYFSFLTLSELEIAFKKGCKEDYGKYFGLNYKTYIGWVNSYKNEQSRSNAINAIAESKKELEPKQKELTSEEKVEIMKNGALIKFEDFKLGKLNDIGNVTYNWLEKKELINFTAQKKKEFMAFAKEQLRADAISGRSTSISKAIEQATSEDKVISMAKKLALNEYFKSLIDMGEELKDIV